MNDFLREDLEEALDRLPDEFRIVVVLVMLQGHSYAEVAEMLCVPVGTALSRLSRGRTFICAMRVPARFDALLKQAGTLNCRKD